MLLILSLFLIFKIHSKQYKAIAFKQKLTEKIWSYLNILLTVPPANKIAQLNI